MFLTEIDRKIGEHAYEWTPETQEFYKQKAQEAVAIADANQKELRDWQQQKTNSILPEYDPNYDSTAASILLGNSDIP